MALAWRLAGVMAYLRGNFTVKTKQILLVGSVLLALFMYFTASAFWGVVVMGGAIVILFFLPWLDRSPVKSMRYRPEWHRGLLICFVINFLILAALPSNFCN